jgi:hypothetical protein
MIISGFSMVRLIVLMRGEQIRNAIKAIDKALRANRKYLKFL